MWSQRSNPWRVLILAAAGVLAVMSAGCDWIVSGTEDFTIRVDSISAPAAISTVDTLAVRFFGTVGSSRCHQLERVEKHVDPAGMQLRFHGEWRNGYCGQMPVSFEHEELVPPPLEGLFTIRVLQPSGPPLERVVRVE